MADHHLHPHNQPSSSTTTTPPMREYRKGNWTFQETMVLIEAKRMDDERRQMKKNQTHHQQHGVLMKMNLHQKNQKQPTELRWKWVEDYCWSRGCYRSQNQCNDKWDNLMRDYKKVRDFQRRSSAGEDDRNNSCYWKLERGERKDKNLPTNLSPQIYEALVEVVDRNFPAPATGSSGGFEFGVSVPLDLTVPVVLPEVQTVLAPAIQGTGQEVSPQPGRITNPDIAREDPDSSQTKRRKTAEKGVQDALIHLQELERQQQQQQQEEELGRATTSGDHESPPLITSTPSSTPEAISSTISTSTTAILDAIRASREGDERRHREMMSLQERMLEIDKSKLEMSKAMVDAINNLASSIISLANSHKP